MEINGQCDPKFERVREEFERNFKEREEVGASVCVTIEGENVVDLWGGTADTEGRHSRYRNRQNMGKGHGYSGFF